MHEIALKAHRTLLDIYAIDIRVAYNAMMAELSALLLGGDILLDDDDAQAEVSGTGGIKIKLFRDISPEGIKKDRKNMQAKVLRVTGRCGGRCGGASKRLLTSYFLARVNDDLLDMDLTSEVVNAISKRSIGRGMDRASRLKYARKGRTAADKSKALTEHKDRLDQWTLMLNGEVDLLKNKCLDIRSDLAAQWVIEWHNRVIEARAERRATP